MVSLSFLCLLFACLLLFPDVGLSLIEKGAMKMIHHSPLDWMRNWARHLARYLARYLTTDLTTDLARELVRCEEKDWKEREDEAGFIFRCVLYYGIVVFHFCLIC